MNIQHKSHIISAQGITVLIHPKPQLSCILLPSLPIQIDDRNAPPKSSGHLRMVRFHEGTIRHAETRMRLAQTTF